MAPEPLTVLHGGYGPELALLEYLSRVLLHLVVFGGVAALVFRVSSAIEALRSTSVAERDGEPTER